MKTIVGIDHDGHYESALRLLGRLRFTPNEVELVHADEPYVTYVPPVYLPDGMDDLRRQGSMELLATASDQACALGLHVTDQRYVLDPPAKALIDESIAHRDDLVAIGAREKSKYGSLFMGSVGRALTNGSRSSVLIAKGDVYPVGNLNVVFATDHSEYSDEAVRLFVRLNPRGIQRLVVLTAIPRFPDGSTNELERTRQTEASRRIVEHLWSFEFPAEYQVVEGAPSEAIDATMMEVKGDLLIVGAQGHGFFERLLLGSVSLQQAVASPHSTMILRPR